MKPLPIEVRPSVTGGRPAKVQYQQQPQTEPSARELLGQAIGTVLRVARHAAEQNINYGPSDIVESTLNDLQGALDASLRRCRGSDGARQ